MKHIIILVISIIFLHSCKDSELNVGTSMSLENHINLTEEHVDAILTKEKAQDTINLHENSFIGKLSTEIEKFNLHTCWASITFQSDNIYVSYVSNSKTECRYGKGKIVLEEITGRKGNRAIFKILDEINVEKKNSKSSYSKVRLKLNNSTEKQEYLINYLDERELVITKIFALWKIDFETNKFKKIEIPKNLKFDNPDWME